MSLLSVDLNHRNSADLTSSQPVPLGIPGTWTLSFQDEFTGTSVDTTKWQILDPSVTWGLISSDPPIGASTPSVYGNTSDFGNQQWSQSLLGVSSSVLTTTATNPTGSGIVSRWAMHFGYYEARLRFTGGSPAFWIAWHGDGNDANGTDEFDGIEIDVAESQFWDGHPTYLTSNVHWGGYGATHHEEGSVAYSTDGAWHTVGLLWTVNAVKIYLDGSLVRTITTYTADVPSADPRKHYLLISNGGPNAGIAEYDYVRHWTGG